MKLKLQFLIFSILLCHICSVFGQNVAIYNQFNGRVDFTFIGNTMNLVENGSGGLCEVLTSSSADLTLNTNDVIESAYLYWAGSGTGDFNVQLNGNSVNAERDFAQILPITNKPFFSAFANVTSLVQTTGNATYTLSELDVSSVLSPTDYCNNGTNFAGWAIVIVYSNTILPINQVNIYDGLQVVSQTQNLLTITLDALNVFDNIGAKIGFVAWEGDAGIQVNETLRINGNILSNPPLNPENNAFNGTNSITGNSDLFNMDLDIYDIQNNIAIGDTTAEIELTSGQDFVMINTVVTKLNNQLPDATITIDQIEQECNSRIITVEYTVYNVNSTDVLPAGVPIAIYTNGTFFQYAETTLPIAVGGSQSSQITLIIPDTIPNDFTLQFVVDDLGTGIGIITELNELNNSFSIPVFSLWVSPEFNVLNDLFSCVESITNVPFDFSNYAAAVLVHATDTVSFHASFEDANANINAIANTTNYTVNQANTTIYVRINNGLCYTITSFDINLILYPSFNNLDAIFTCRENETSSFDFSNYQSTVAVNTTDLVQFFETLQNANDNINPIIITSNYIPTATPATIFVRIDNGFCYSTTSFLLDYYELPTFNALPTLLSCNEGFTSGTFNFSGYENTVKTNPNDAVAFFPTLLDAQSSTNEIIDTFTYVATSTPSEIFIRIDNENCSNFTSFLLTTENCPPTIYNYISANGDEFNPTFHIDGLRDIFLNHTIEIYNRWGKLIWEGNNNVPEWDGFSNEGFRFDSSNSPKGTYYYILNLNDSNYSEKYQGYLYFTK